MKDKGKNGIMRITSAPTGQAPLEVREKWIGVEIPFLDIGMPTGSVRGVLDGQKVKLHSAFTVDQVEALSALRKKSSKAADWWARMGFPIEGAQFTFNVECAEVID
jgi:hypothetical protein